MGSIQVQSVGKAYKQYPTRWSRLAEWVIPGTAPRHALKWILRDVTFSVKPGEAVGMIGINGAGKSTLLKIITGTTQPSCGSVQVNGRVAALLELGIGFHPEFTGRQNVYMAGQLLGLSAEEISQLMPQIESFAEIGRYIDEPVRVYSSGMQVRLAFSVATARRPDILIIDEALSVGDAYFQHKCIDRIRDCAAQGTTLLIVSHDAAAILALCDRAILLDSGGLAMQGDPQTVMDFYNAKLAERANTKISQEVTPAGIQTVSGTSEASVVGIALLDDEGRPIEMADVGQRVTLRVTVRVNAPLKRLVLGYMIKDRLGQQMFGTNTHHLSATEYDLSPGESLTYSFSFDAALGVGTYSVATALADSASHLSRNFEWRDLAAVFQVANLSKPPFVGAAYLPPIHQIERGRECRE
jgi:lipopolysaccharide transport system ATP-binding protein